MDKKIKESYDRLPDTISHEDRMLGAQFITATSGDDDLAIIIRAHLYLESTLSLLIEEHLVEPGALEVDRLNFSTKVGLAVALGALPITLREPLQMANSLRNRFAHDIHAQVSASQVDRFFKSFSKDDRAVISEDRALGTLLAVLFGALQGSLGRAKLKPDKSQTSIEVSPK
jgi:hypothetical protein